MWDSFNEWRFERSISKILSKKSAERLKSQLTPKSVLFIVNYNEKDAKALEGFKTKIKGAGFKLETLFYAETQESIQDNALSYTNKETTNFGAIKAEQITSLAMKNYKYCVFFSDKFLKHFEFLARIINAQLKISPRSAGLERLVDISIDTNDKYAKSYFSHIPNLVETFKAS